MNFGFSLSDGNGLTRVIWGEPGVCHLDIENKDTSTGTLYMADEPGDQVVLLSNTVSGKDYLDYPAALVKSGIELGMDVGGHAAIPAGAQVVRRQDLPGDIVRIYISRFAGSPQTGINLTFSPRPPDDVNGTSLVPGQRRELTAEQGNAFLDRPIRLYAMTTTQCDVVVRRGKR